MHSRCLDIAGLIFNCWLILSLMNCAVRCSSDFLLYRLSSNIAACRSNTLLDKFLNTTYRYSTWNETIFAAMRPDIGCGLKNHIFSVHCTTHARLIHISSNVHVYIICNQIMGRYGVISHPEDQVSIQQKSFIDFPKLLETIFLLHVLLLVFSKYPICFYAT